MINQESFSIFSDILHKLINDAKNVQLNNACFNLLDKNSDLSSENDLNFMYNEFNNHQKNIEQFMRNLFNNITVRNYSKEIGKEISMLFKLINVTDIFQSLRKTVFINVENPNRFIEKEITKFEECPKLYNTILFDEVVTKFLESLLTRKDDTIITDTEQTYAFSFDDSFDNTQEENLVFTKKLSIYKKPLITGHCYKNVNCFFGYSQKTIKVKFLTYINFNNFIYYEKTDSNRSNFSYD